MVRSDNWQSEDLNSYDLITLKQGYCSEANWSQISQCVQDTADWNVYIHKQIHINQILKYGTEIYLKFFHFVFGAQRFELMRLVYDLSFKHNPYWLLWEFHIIHPYPTHLPVSVKLSSILVIPSSCKRK